VSGIWREPPWKLGGRVICGKMKRTGMSIVGALELDDGLAEGAKRCDWSGVQIVCRLLN
jgi:hypothetical protein